MAKSIDQGYITEEEKVFLDCCVESGSFIFLEVFKSIISTQIKNYDGGNESDVKGSLISRVTGNILGLGTEVISFALGVGPIIGSALHKGTKTCAQKLLLHFEKELKKNERQNILSWTNSLSKSGEASLIANVTQGMAYICIAFKDQLKEIPENDSNRLNFFSDIVRRILKHLSQHSGHAKILNAEMIYNAFINGKSTPKKISGTRVSKARGLIVASDEAEWNTRDIFENYGHIEPIGEELYVLHIRKGTEKEHKTKFHFRFKFSFEEKIWEEHVETDIQLDDLKDDWRLKDENIQQYVQNISNSMSNEPTDILRSLASASSEIMCIKKAIEKMEQNQMLSTNQIFLGSNTTTDIISGDFKPIPLKTKWWPDKKLLIKSLHKRLIGDRLLVEELHHKINNDENKRAVIFETSNASKLSGMGGIGKTTTAKWYAHHYEQEYDHIIWIDCGEGSLMKSFKNLARDLRVEYWLQITDIKDLARKSFEILSKFKCLWIYDNAESYQDKEGIKDVLPKSENTFFSLITSRHREWGSQNGLGKISEIGIDVFTSEESVEFFKTNLEKEILYNDFQLRELAEFLGNLPLAIQLAITTLNNGKISLTNYIKQTYLQDVSSLLDSKFDDYERTIGMNISIILESVKKEKLGVPAYNILLIFGYIRPDYVESEFLIRVTKMEQKEFKMCLDLLENYSLITKIALTQKQFTLKPFRSNSDDSNSVETNLLSIHRLLQQVIRLIDKNNEKQTLRKILKCKGFLDYKLIPYCQFADNELKKEFKKIKIKLLDQMELSKLLQENRFSEAAELSLIIKSSLKSFASSYNYAVCLFKKEDYTNAAEVLENLRDQISQKKTSILKDRDNYYPFVDEEDIIALKVKPDKSIVAGLLFLTFCKQKQFQRALQILFQEMHLLLKYSLDALHHMVQSMAFVSMMDISPNGMLIFLDYKTTDVQLKIDAADNPYQIPPKNYKIENSVYRTGLLATVYDGRIGEVSIVAKTSRSHMLKYLFFELKTLLHLGKHSNIIQLVGTCTAETKRGKIYLFYERSSLGNLQDILKKEKFKNRFTPENPEHDLSANSEEDMAITESHLYSWSFQLAKALEFLKQKLVIHRLLMARNILLFEDNLIKVTDFELSIKIENRDHRTADNNVPYARRWSAIECLRQSNFSFQSDIWSFGVVLWELFSLGETPYSKMLHLEELPEMLEQNQRLHQPKLASDGLYNFMLSCWRITPEERPDAKTCLNFFETMTLGSYLNPKK